VKVLIAPDSFKESLTAIEVSDCIEQGILNYKPDTECIKLPLADGGEGTIDAILQAVGGKKIYQTVKDPLLRDIQSFWGLLPDNKTAVLEMAAASGLELLSNEERNPMLASTYGTGQLIKASLEYGCKKIFIGIGGSATNDGGAGMAMALGAKLIDGQGRLVDVGGKFLSEIHSIDLSDFDPRIYDCEITVISDVENPLCGKNGASYIYGPQKGADPSMVNQLDLNLLHFGNLLELYFKKEVVKVPGAGAAGGLGAGLLAFCNARIKPGFETISDIVKLENAILKADIIFTGEGKMDYQTTFGKTPAGVARLSMKHNKRVIGIAGSLGEGYQELYKFGFQGIFPICEKPQSLDYSIKNARMLIINAVERIIRLISMEV